MGESGEGRVAGILITIVILGGVNLLSYLFGWNFWLY